LRVTDVTSVVLAVVHDAVTSLGHHVFDSGASLGSVKARRSAPPAPRLRP
jgi:hypothetical protein